MLSTEMYYSHMIGIIHQARYSLYLRFGGVWRLLYQQQRFSDSFLEDCHIDVEGYDIELDFLEKNGSFVEVADNRNYERHDESREYAHSNFLARSLLMNAMDMPLKMTIAAQTIIVIQFAFIRFF